MKKLLKKAENTVKKAGKDAEAFVKDASKDITAAANSVILENATSNQLEAATNRANNVKERLSELSPRIDAAKKKADYISDSNDFPITYDKDEYKQLFTDIASQHAALCELYNQIEQKRQDIENRPDDGSTSRTSARDDCDALLAQQIELETISLLNLLI
jgi:small-conductance mechanosensitive channel